MNRVKKIKNSRGFVILFAVTIASIVLAVALGVAEISLKEIKFGTSAKDTNDAFFAADTGIEYVLFQDKTPVCTPPAGGGTCNMNYTIPNIGSTGKSCAKVALTKSNQADPLHVIVLTHVVSDGYNLFDASGSNCSSSSDNQIEREIITNY